MVVWHRRWWFRVRDDGGILVLEVLVSTIFIPLLLPSNDAWRKCRLAAVAPEVIRRDMRGGCAVIDVRRSGLMNVVSTMAFKTIDGRDCNKHVGVILTLLTGDWLEGDIFYHVERSGVNRKKWQIILRKSAVVRTSLRNVCLCLRGYSNLCSKSNDGSLFPPPKQIDLSKLSRSPVGGWESKQNYLTMICIFPHHSMKGEKDQARFSAFFGGGVGEQTLFSPVLCDPISIVPNKP